MDSRSEKEEHMGIVDLAERPTGAYDYPDDMSTQTGEGEGIYTGELDDPYAESSVDVEFAPGVITPYWSAHQHHIDQQVDPLAQPLIDAWNQSGSSDQVQWPEPNPAADPIFGPGATFEE